MDRRNRMTKKKKKLGLFIMVRVVDGKVGHEGRWEGCTANDLSLALTSLEMIKKDLLEAYTRIMVKKKS